MLLKAGGKVHILRRTPHEGLVKKELRTEMRAVLAGIPPATLQEQSRRAAERLFALPLYKRAEVIMVYLSLPQEADTTPLVLQAWKDRKRVLAPQVSWESKQMIPVEINDLDADVADTPYGIRAPIRGTPFPIGLIDLVIVPGLAFDPQGNRLGRGRGFYDRFLSKPEFHGTICAFAHEQQFVKAIPCRPHDIQVQVLVTNEKVRRFPKKAL